MMDWVGIAIRGFFLSIDKIVYWAIGAAYELMMQIANINFFANETYTMFANRVYMFLAIIMLFKLSFSLITYIVNPDEFTNKEKGLGKIVTNSMIVLVLVITVPYIFSLARELQVLILKENIIPAFILGDDANEEDKASITTQGDDMAFIFFSSMFQIDEIALKQMVDDNSDYSMEDYNSENTNGVLQCSTSLYQACSTDEESSSGLNCNCVDLLNNADLITINAGFDSNYDSLGDLLEAIAINKNLKALMNSDLEDVAIEANGVKVPVLDYKFILSTIIGIVAALLFISFCFDIAIRSVKLCFLEIIAPLPIISYIDPKSGKSGVFNKWLKMCFKTYADLFIRLAAVFFAVFLITRLNLEFSTDAYRDAYGSIPLFAIVFAYLGILLFAKQLPKLLENILGIKMDGGFNLSPMKKLASVPGLAKAVGTAGGIHAGIKYGKESGHPFRGAIGGLLTGGRGVTEKDGILGSFGKGASNSAKNMFGKDYRMWSVNDVLPGKTKAKSEIDELKRKRNFLNGKAAVLEAQAADAAKAGDEATAESLYGMAAKIKGKAATYDDQAKTIKTQFRIDESAKKDLESADKLLHELGYYDEDDNIPTPIDASSRQNGVNRTNNSNSGIPVPGPSSGSGQTKSSNSTGNSQRASTGNTTNDGKK